MADAAITVGAIIVVGGNYVTAHSTATGEELWRSGGLNPTKNKNFRVIASPLVKDGMILGLGTGSTAVQITSALAARAAETAAGVTDPSLREALETLAGHILSRPKT